MFQEATINRIMSLIACLLPMAIVSPLFYVGVVELRKNNKYSASYMFLIAGIVDTMMISVWLIVCFKLRDKVTPRNCGVGIDQSTEAGEV